jgi:hypothetical protein
MAYFVLETTLVKLILSLIGMASVMLHAGTSAATSVASSQTCPSEFFTLPLYPTASLCQLFDQQLPASLIYHANSDQEATRAFYQDALGDPQTQKSAKGRIVMQYQDGQHIIIISPDGQGTQVDILVKTTDNTQTEDK